jgi:hypothetical protein
MKNMDRLEIHRHINRAIGQKLDISTYFRMVTLVAMLPEDADQRNQAIYKLSDGAIPAGLDLVTVANGHAVLELDACMALVEEPSNLGEAVAFLAANHNAAMAQMMVNKQLAEPAPVAESSGNLLNPFAKLRAFLESSLWLALGVFAGATFFA